MNLASSTLHGQTRASKGQFDLQNFVMFAAMFSEIKQLKVAILDLYEGQANQGMRCIREIVNQFAEFNSLDLVMEEFEVRMNQQLPDLSYDVYISSGGPGSPLESEGTEWEKKYFDFVAQLTAYNENHTHA